MTAPYREVLDQLRQHFPQPVSDRVHDAYFVFSILRALDEVDGLKSEIPLLGIGQPLDYSGVGESRIPENPSTVESVTAELVKTLEGLPIWGHPRAQINVVAPPSIPSIIGSLLPAIYNPNLVSEESSMGVAMAEARAMAMAAHLVGYDPRSAVGTFTFGGTGTTLYGVKAGLEKAMPGSMENGLSDEAVILVSSQGHYCKLNIAGWLGIGESNVIEVPTHLDNSIKLDALEKAARKAISEGKKIAAFIATMGSTDAFGIDDLEAMAGLRDALVEELNLDYRPHLHADAVIGWAWSVFNDYPFEENPLGFRPRTVRALAGARRRISKLHLADSIGFDFHKTGFTPYISSLVLFRDRGDLDLLTRGREKMPYLFQTGDRHPGVFTLETSRNGGSILAALANLNLLGKTGLRTLLGHVVEMAELLREHLEGHSYSTVVNGENFGTVSLFRVYPDNVDTWTVKERERTDPTFHDKLLEYNEYNRKIFHYLHRQAMQGRGVLLSMTECYRKTAYGAPILALKSYMLSPFIDEEHIELIVDKISEAREHV